MSRAEILPLPFVERPWPDSIEASRKGGRRVYSIPHVGDLVPVTTAIDSTVGLWGRYLNEWYARTEREAVLLAVSQAFQWSVGMTGDAFVASVEAGMGKARAAQTKMEKAGDIGTEVHAMIRWKIRGLLGQSVPPPPVLRDEATLAYMAWEDWWNASGLVPLVAEQMVYDELLGCAGTFDLLAQDDAGKILLDWKSSNYILAKHHIQVGGYLGMVQQWRPGVTRAAIVRVPKSLNNINIEVQPLGRFFDPDAKKFKTRSFEEMHRSFRAALTLYETFLMEEHRDDEPTGRDEPGPDAPRP